MHKILITARKAKGVSEEEVATMLGIDQSEYQSLEAHRQAVSPARASKLADYFSVPAYYFLDTNQQINIADRITLLRRHLQIINPPELRQMPAGATLAFTTVSIELMIAKDELSQSLSRELELAEDFASLSLLNEHLTDVANPKPSTHK